MTPEWLATLAWVSLAVAGACALVILIDIVAGHRQHMAIMNLVWPITGLYAGPLALAAYFGFGRMSHSHHGPMQMKHAMPASVALAATHCGAGCTLGDILAEPLVAAFGLTLLGRRMFAAWVVDFILAYAIGILFQYFAIVPMKHLSPGRGIVVAIKADTLSLLAWQLGMYGWMAIATFALFDHELSPASTLFWFMMQIAMVAGFLTAYPVNWWLVSSGIKERM